jgi:hypothetical protein
MANFHHFLEEHAKFPFPQPDKLRSVGTTDVSQLEVALLRGKWKAARAVRDDTLFLKLCHTLQDILGDTSLRVDSGDYLLPAFSPRLGTDMRNAPDVAWSKNPDESKASFSTPR